MNKLSPRGLFVFFNPLHSLPTRFSRSQCGYVHIALVSEIGTARICVFEQLWPYTRCRDGPSPGFENLFRKQNTHF
ncbi:MAG: hypothetical protein ACKV1O_28350 [Saprospiraceae bacterium]